MCHLRINYGLFIALTEYIDAQQPIEAQASMGYTGFMRLTVLYREQSDHARAVSEFMSMLSRYYPGKTAELLDIDTRDGAAEASLHGVMQYPALIVTSFEGRVIQQWEGMPLPVLDEVASMVVSQENALV